MITRPKRTSYNKPLSKTDNSKLLLHNNVPSPPQIVIDLYQKFMENLDSSKLIGYPDINTAYILLSKHLNIDSELLYLGSGSDYVLRHVIESLQGPGLVSSMPLIFPTPTYGMLPVYADIFNMEKIPIPYEYSHDNFRLHLPYDKINNLKNAILYIASPDNFTGCCEHIKDVLRQVSRHIFVIWDAAYFCFFDSMNEVADMVNDNQNLIIVNTFSKSFAIAGLRLGYSIANSSITNRIQELRPAHEIGSVQVAFLEFITHHDNVQDFILSEVNESRKIIKNLFKKNKIKIIADGGLYITVRADDNHVKRLNEFINTRIFNVQNNQFFRITMPSKENANRFEEWI